MSHPSSAEPAGPPAPRRWSRVIARFVGLPFTAFMLLDLWANSKAAQGAVVFRHALEPIRTWPAWVVTSLAVVVLLDVVGIGRRALTRREASAAMQGLGGVAMAAVALRLGLFWRALLLPGHTLEDVRSALIAETSRTSFGVPWLAYLWLLALAASAAFCGRAAPTAVERWLGRHGLGARRGVVVGSTLLAGVAFLFAGASVLTLATGLRPLVGDDIARGACTAP